MVSIWDSGIDYGAFMYDNPAFNSTVYGFDNSENKNPNIGDEEKNTKKKLVKTESVKLMPEEKVVQKSPDVLGEAPSWDEFTNKTTFHGIKYVFDRNSSGMQIRR